VYLTPMSLPPAHREESKTKLGLGAGKSATMQPAYPGRASSPGVKQAACILWALSHAGAAHDAEMSDEIPPQPQPLPMQQQSKHVPVYQPQQQSPAYTLTPFKQEPHSAASRSTWARV